MHIFMAYTDLFSIRLAWVLTQMMTTSVFQFWCGKPVVIQYRVEVLVISQAFYSLECQNHNLRKRANCHAKTTSSFREGTTKAASLELRHHTCLYSIAIRTWLKCF